MRNYSKFIPGEEIDAVKQWDFGAVDTASLLLAAQVKQREAVTEQVNVEAVRQEAYAEGFAQGRAQATLEAQRQMADYVASQGSAGCAKFLQSFFICTGATGGCRAGDGTGHSSNWPVGWRNRFCAMSCR